MGASTEHATSTRGGTVTTARVLSSLAGAVLAAAAACGAAAILGWAWDAAGAAWGEEALLLWTVVALAAGIALMCAYLAVIWALAGLVLAAGPGGAVGRSLLGVLRVLSPRLARRVVATAVMATAVSSIALGSAQASTADADPGQGPTIASTLQGSLTSLPASTDDGADERSALAFAMEGRLPAVPTGASDTPHVPGPTPSEPHASDPAQTPAPDLPPLGWAEAPAASETDAPAPPSAAPDTAPPVAAPVDAPDPVAREVVVGEGDCLWSITDDLLGPGRDTDAAIDEAWPRLYRANADQIGSDPDIIQTGQRLIVPADLAVHPSQSQEAS